MKLNLLFLLALFALVFATTESNSLRALQDQADVIEEHHDEGEAIHFDENGFPVHDDEEEMHYEDDGHDHEEGEEHHEDDGHDEVGEVHSEGDGHDDHGDEEHLDDHGDEEHHHEDDGHDHGGETTVSSVASSSQDKPWGAAIGAALLVNLATLVGVLVLVPTMLGGRYFKSTKTSEKHFRWFLYTLLPSFAAGALLATTVFLLLPESILLIGNETGATEHAHRNLQEEHNAEGEMAWKFGASFLGGFLLPIIMGSLFPHNHEDEKPQPQCPVCEEEHSVCDFQDVDKAILLDVSVGSVSTCDGDLCHKDNHCHEEGKSLCGMSLRGSWRMI